MFFTGTHPRHMTSRCLPHDYCDKGYHLYHNNHEPIHNPDMFPGLWIGSVFTDHRLALIRMNLLFIMDVLYDVVPSLRYLELQQQSPQSCSQVLSHPDRGSCAFHMGSKHLQNPREAREELE